MKKRGCLLNISIVTGLFIFSSSAAYAANSCVGGYTAEGNSLSLSCPQGQVISSIPFASFGTPKNGTSATCGSYSTGTCNSSTSISKVQTACLGKASCAVAATNSNFGDPCSGTAKYLAIQVACSAPAASPTACVGSSTSEGNSLTLSCPQGQVISSIPFASFGTPKAGTSNSCGSFSAGSCNSASSLSTVQAACLGKATCSVSATNSIFGDPCSGTAKSLAIQVGCSASAPAPAPAPAPASTCLGSSTAEGNSLTLSCPQGQVISSVPFASFGTPNAGTSNSCGSFSTGSCNSSSSLSMVQAACVGKSSCSVTASNSIFGDPCSGTAKSLAVQVACSAGTASAPAPAPAPAPTTSTTTGVPTPQTIAGKTVVGRIDAVSGQVIQNVHVVNHNGPCIVLNGVNNITIKNSEIGPCGDSSNAVGDVGINILGGSTQITISQNVIHDASNLINGNDVRGPVTIDRNLFYNIRGTQWEASAIQFGESRNHSGQIKITCNTIDDRLVTSFPMAGGRQRRNEDHINMYNTGGNSSYPLEIAYNRIRGALDGWGGISGTGMQLGDSQAGGGGVGSNTPGYIYTHHNIIYWTNGGGIDFAGGTTGNRVEYNMVDNRGSGPGPSTNGSQVMGQGTSDTGWPFVVRKYDATTSMSISFIGNLANSNLWAWNNDGSQGPSASSVFSTPGISINDQGGNNFQYTGFGTTLGVNTIWDQPVAAPCQ